MADLPDGALLWPAGVLRPLSIQPNPVPFTRGGGPSLEGLELNTRTDRGFWSIAYKGVVLKEAAQRKVWNAIRGGLGGKAGLVAVPVWSFDSAPWLDGAVLGEMLTTHSDGSTFSDGSSYSQPGLLVEMAALAALGATSVTLRLVHGLEDLSGIRFSYNHALYETGFPTLVSGDEWTVPVTPAIRAAIPADAALDVDRPTCLCHLASDDAMNVNFSRGKVDRCDVSFVEANDYWNALAIA